MLLFLVLGYTKTIKKGITNLSERKENNDGFNDNSISSICVGFRMKYKIESEYVEYQKITIENEFDSGYLCRVDINHRLFKIIYLDPHSVVEILYDRQEEIIEVEVSELK